MSGLPRWKENRIRQEIHLAHLKHAKTSANGAGVDGTYSFANIVVLSGHRHPGV